MQNLNTIKHISLHWPIYIGNCHKGYDVQWVILSEIRFMDGERESPLIKFRYRTVDGKKEMVYFEPFMNKETNNIWTKADFSASYHDWKLEIVHGSFTKEGKERLEVAIIQLMNECDGKCNSWI
jgi:hypothetical protein